MACDETTRFARHVLVYMVGLFGGIFFSFFERGAKSIFASYIFGGMLISTDSLICKCFFIRSTKLRGAQLLVLMGEHLRGVMTCVSSVRRKDFPGDKIVVEPLLIRIWTNDTRKVPPG